MENEFGLSKLIVNLFDKNLAKEARNQVPAHVTEVRKKADLATKDKKDAA